MRPAPVGLLIHRPADDGAFALEKHRGSAGASFSFPRRVTLYFKKMQTTITAAPARETDAVIPECTACPIVLTKADP